MSLKPHQREDVRFLVKRTRAYLANVPGAGKTRPLLVAADLVAPEEIWVVGPAAARDVWPMEALAVGLRTPLRFFSYSEVVRRSMTAPPNAAKCLLIIDEAQALAHTSAQQTRRLLSKTDWAGIFGWVWLASGTPMPRHPGDLWPVLSRCFPSHLPPYIRTGDQWLRTTCDFFYTDRDAVKVTRVKRPELVREVLFGGAAPMMRQVTEAQLGESWPGIRWTIQRMGSTEAVEEAEAAALAAGVTLETVKRVDKEREASEYRHEIGLLKVGRVVPLLLEHLEEDPRPMIVFAHHHDVLDELYGELRGAGVTVAPYDGRSSPLQRFEAVRAFQAGEARVFVGGIRACQTAITLTRAASVHFVEPDWSFTGNLQGAKRAARLGQPLASVEARMYSFVDTIDEGIIAQHQREGEMQAAIFSGWEDEPQLEVVP